MAVQVLKYIVEKILLEFLKKLACLNLINFDKSFDLK